MDLWSILKISFRSLSRNKLRTFLTMLGIIIGVGAVVAMLSITNGAKKTIIDIIQGLGNNSVYVFAAPSTRGGVNLGSSNTLKPADAAAIQRLSSHVMYASPVIPQQARIIYRNRNWMSTVYGGNEHLHYIQAWNIEEGNFFTASEVASASKVCVIGQIVVDNLFNPGEEPVGKTIRINRIPYRVVGLLKSKGGAGSGQDQDDVVMIPYTTMMQRMYKRDHINMIIASAESRESTMAAVDDITFILRQRHRLGRGVPDDFQVRTQDEIIKLVSSYIQTLSLLLGSVASISLLVGGIGIMNIMLVSVAERIREIGIRMALGAQKRDILNQFLTEAVALSLAGGILGILFGAVLGRIVGSITKWQVLVSIDSIILAMAFSIGVGVFFGFYPAWKASKLDPIVALRHE